MPGIDDPRTLRRLSALAELDDDSFVAMLEAQVARGLLERVMSRIARGKPKKKPNIERQRQRMEARREITDQLRRLDQVILTEGANWQFLADQRRAALEEVSLWRPVTQPSKSRLLFPSGTATTTGSSST